MILARKEAIVLCSYLEFLDLSESDKAFKVETALAELDLESAPDDVLNFHVRNNLTYIFRDYLNSYLQSYLSDKVKRKIEVNGKEPKKYPCAC